MILFRAMSLFGLWSDSLRSASRKNAVADRCHLTDTGFVFFFYKAVFKKKSLSCVSICQPVSDSISGRSRFNFPIQEQAKEGEEWPTEFTTTDTHLGIGNPHTSRKAAG
jgi:hypothetical protein